MIPEDELTKMEKCAVFLGETAAGVVHQLIREIRRRGDDVRTALTLMDCESTPAPTPIPRSGCMCERCGFARRVLGQ
jgi:hypothetical protein